MLIKRMPWINGRNSPAIPKNIKIIPKIFLNKLFMGRSFTPSLRLWRTNSEGLLLKNFLFMILF